jgi:hypothetical protein
MYCDNCGKIENLNDNKSTPKIKKSDSPLISKIMVDLADEFNFRSHETSA